MEGDHLPHHPLRPGSLRHPLPRDTLRRRRKNLPGDPHPAGSPVRKFKRPIHEAGEKDRYTSGNQGIRQPHLSLLSRTGAHAVRTAIERPEYISLEIIDIQANPEIANRYSAFSVPQTFANEILIAQGAQSEELFILSLEKLEQQTIFIPESDAAVVETDVVHRRRRAGGAFRRNLRGAQRPQDRRGRTGRPRGAGGDDAHRGELPRIYARPRQDAGGHHREPRPRVRANIPGRGSAGHSPGGRVRGRHQSEEIPDQGGGSRDRRELQAPGCPG